MDILTLYRHLKNRVKYDNWGRSTQFYQGYQSGFKDVLRWIRREALEEYLRRREYRALLRREQMG